MALVSSHWSLKIIVNINVLKKLKCINKMKSFIMEKKSQIQSYLNSGSKKLDAVSKQVIRSRKKKKNWIQ